MAGALVEKGRAFIEGFWNGAKEVWNTVLDWVRNLPNMVLEAIGDTSRKLYDSGASLIQGFNEGMNSKVEDARAAGHVAVDAASNPFPQSPAKEGPFSGTGWTLYRGQSLIDGFIEGIMSKVPDLRARVSEVMGQAQGVLSQVEQARTMAAQAIARGGTYSDPRFGSATIAPGGGKIELKVAPGADSALSSMLMNLVRTGQLQLARL
jgi:hypothetical protein